MNVLLVEDSPFVMPALKDCITSIPNLNLTDCITNAANAKILCLRRKIDLIIMDVCTADNESGIKAAAEIKEFSPRTKIIIVTSMPEFSFVTNAKKAGCEGFWYKTENIESLKTVIEGVLDGKTIYPDITPPVRIMNISSGILTDRELQIIKHLAQGKKYDEIAVLIGISINTVKSHMRNIFTKTGCSSSVELVAECVKSQIILPGY